MIINGENLILGRLASFVSKKALMGQTIKIVNCEKVMITGKKTSIAKKYKTQDERGKFLKGPYQPKTADRFVRRVIRNMLPYKQHKGKEAFKRIMCYLGIPEELSKQKLETIKEANIAKTQNLKYTTVGEICKLLK